MQEQNFLYNISFYQNFIAKNPDSVAFRLKLLEENKKLEEWTLNFEKKYPKYYELKYKNCDIQIKDVQNILDSSTVVVSYTILNHKLLIFLISQSKYLFHSIELTDSLKYFSFSIVKFNIKFE